MNKIYIYCTFDLEGFHRWDEATEETYLQNCHRHLFKFKCKVEVRGTNREVEFIQMAGKVKMFLLTQYPTDSEVACQFNNMSCEDMAKKILQYLKANYGDERSYIIDCSEDGENGAEVTWIPEAKKDQE